MKEGLLVFMFIPRGVMVGGGASLVALYYFDMEHRGELSGVEITLNSPPHVSCGRDAHRKGARW